MLGISHGKDRRKVRETSGLLLTSRFRTSTVGFTVTLSICTIISPIRTPACSAEINTAADTLRQQGTTRRVVNTATDTEPSVHVGISKALALRLLLSTFLPASFRASRSSRVGKATISCSMGLITCASRFDDGNDGHRREA